MKCTNCDSEMIELKKGGPLTNNSMEPGSNVESIVYDIDYDKAKDILPKIMETKGNKLYITPEMYVCPECGEIKQRLKSTDLKVVLALEAE